MSETRRGLPLIKDEKVRESIIFQVVNAASLPENRDALIEEALRLGIMHRELLSHRPKYVEKMKNEIRSALSAFTDQDLNKVIKEERIRILEHLIGPDKE